jgi:hypothetical protein
LIGTVFASTLRLMCRPALFVPAVAISVGAEAAILLNGWPRPGFDGLPAERALTYGILIVLARSWLDLTLVAVAMALARGERAGLLRNWVHVLRALKIAAVSVVLLVGIAIGTLCFVLPGVYLLLRWSQVVPALLDRQVRMLDATRFSEAIASAYYLYILLIWAIAWAVPALVEQAAALYVELERRALAPVPPVTFL